MIPIAVSSPVDKYDRPQFYFLRGDIPRSAPKGRLTHESQCGRQLNWFLS